MGSRKNLSGFVEPDSVFQRYIVKIKPKVEVKMFEVYEVSKVGESKVESLKMEN